MKTLVAGLIAVVCFAASAVLLALDIAGWWAFLIPASLFGLTAVEEKTP